MVSGRHGLWVLSVNIPRATSRSRRGAGRRLLARRCERSPARSRKRETLSTAEAIEIRPRGVRYFGKAARRSTPCRSFGGCTIRERCGHQAAAVTKLHEGAGFFPSTSYPVFPSRSQPCGGDRRPGIGMSASLSRRPRAQARGSRTPVQFVRLEARASSGRPAVRRWLKSFLVDMLL